MVHLAAILNYGYHVKLVGNIDVLMCIKDHHFFKLVSLSLSLSLFSRLASKNPTWLHFMTTSMSRNMQMP